MGFTQSKSDPCIYTGGENSIIGVYVDDMVLASRSKGMIKTLKKQLSEKFNIKDLGLLKYFLGISVDQAGEKTWIGQPNYTRKLLKKYIYGMEDCKPVSTPVSVGQQLIQAKDGEKLVDQTRYQSLIGSLMYLHVHLHST